MENKIIYIFFLNFYGCEKLRGFNLKENLEVFKSYCTA